jgi:hypothetical protein
LASKSKLQQIKYSLVFTKRQKKIYATNQLESKSQKLNKKLLNGIEDCNQQVLKKAGL